MPDRDATPAETDDPQDVSVSTLELFFDLVFVFAFTRVTASIVEDHSGEGLLRAALVFAMLWWAWGAYAWLTNAVDTGETGPRLVVLSAMAAMLVTALAVPTAWDGGGVAFALGYLVVMVLHAALFALAGSDTASTRRAVMRLAPTNIVPALLLVIAGTTEGGVRTALWVAAVALTYAGPYLTGVAGFTVAPAHFVERHGLIIIIALGESVVAIGAVGDIEVDGAVALTALVVMALVAGLWWDYFTDDAEATASVLLAADDRDRPRFARDVYSYLHVPLVFGIVCTAVGIHEVLVHSDEPLDAPVAAVFAGGVGLFFAGLGAIRRRRGDRAGPLCLTAIAVALAMVVLGRELDAVVTTGVLAAASLGVAVARTPARRMVESGP